MKLELQQDVSKKTHEQVTGKDVLLGVRPQHAVLHRLGETEANGRNVVSGTVYVAEPLGTEQLVRVQVGSELVYRF